MPLHCSKCGATTEVTPGSPSLCSACGAPLAIAAPTVGAPLQTSKLAIGSLVASLIICLPGLNMIVGVALGIAALVKISNHPRELKGQGLAIAGIVLSVASLFFGGIMAAIAIPNFIKFQERAKNSEARANLRSLGTAERSYHAEHQAFLPFGPVPPTMGTQPTPVPESALPAELGFALSGPVRFQYEGVVEGAGSDAALVLHARRNTGHGVVEFTERVTEAGLGPVEGRD
jgi:hypothetical protein